MRTTDVHILNNRESSKYHFQEPPPLNVWQQKPQLFIAAQHTTLLQENKSQNKKKILKKNNSKTLQAGGNDGMLNDSINPWKAANSNFQSNQAMWYIRCSLLSSDALLAPYIFHCNNKHYKESFLFGFSSIFFSWKFVPFFCCFFFFFFTCSCCSLQTFEYKILPLLSPCPASRRHRCCPIPSQQTFAKNIKENS